MVLIFYQDQLEFLLTYSKYRSKLIFQKELLIVFLIFLCFKLIHVDFNEHRSKIR